MKLFSLLFFILFISQSIAAETFKPFTQGNPAGDTVEAAVAAVSAKLEAVGFEVVGIETPYANGSAKVLGITNDILKAAASSVTIGKKKIGGFGAVLHVAITNNNGAIEVTYMNPTYIAYAYQMGDLSAVKQALAEALGAVQDFGAAGKTAKQLENYQYAPMMPKFRDPEVVGKFKSHQEAVDSVAKALENDQAEMTKVWQVKVNEDQTVFGVHLAKGPWKDDKIFNIMQNVDVNTPRSTAALPWEILVSGEKVYALKGKYRLAVMFPDLGMGTFMKVQEVPGDMSGSAKQVVKKLAGGK